MNNIRNGFCCQSKMDASIAVAKDLEPISLSCDHSTFLRIIFRVIPQKRPVLSSVVFNTGGVVG